MLGLMSRTHVDLILFEPSLHVNPYKKKMMTCAVSVILPVTTCANNSDIVVVKKELIIFQIYFFTLVVECICQATDMDLSEYK